MPVEISSASPRATQVTARDAPATLTSIPDHPTELVNRTAATNAAYCQRAHA